MTNQPFPILLLEDSEEDLFLFERAVSKVGRVVSLHAARNGTEARQYLLGEEKFSDRAQFPMPTVIFSDLQLPGMNGLQFLEWLRQEPSVRAIPCVLFSGSANPTDIHTAYELGVTSFIVKPVDFSEWVARLEIVLKFWMDIATRPSVEI